MLILFSLINISFLFFFLLFWRYIESILFGVIFIIFIVYFSKILSFFVEKDEINTNDKHYTNKKINIYSMKLIIEYIKKWSYYISFLFFYISLYGFIYSLNLIYNFSYPSEIFHTISLIISIVVTGIFFLFLYKKYEIIFLIFRSNCIIFTIIYVFLLIFFLTNNIEPSILFVVNSTFPIITLLSIILFDFFFQKNIRYIYSFFLLYIFIFFGYYVFYIFSYIWSWNVFLWIISFFTILYTFVFWNVKIFQPYKEISYGIWVMGGYILSFCTGFVLTFYSFSLFYLFPIGISIFYHYLVYKQYKNYASYIIFLFTFIFLYIKIFILLEINSFIFYAIFTFLLSFILLGYSYMLYQKNSKEQYILHFMAVCLSLGSIVYYFIFIWDRENILHVSTFLFFTSILFFVSYIWFKK